jgi:phosphohistidine phosphatase
MQLMLVRHAIAFDRDSARWADDAARPLSARGVTRARKAAAGLKVIGPLPTRVLVSPLLRTRQTAAILSEFSGWPKAALCDELEPGKSAQEFLALLTERGSGCIAAVGHEPNLSGLLGLCLGGTAGAFALRKMGAALVSFRGRPAAGHGELVWFLPPRVLRAAR